MRIFALADGRVVNGLVAEQADRTVTIQTPTERIVVPRDEIEAERKSDVSLMPEGQLDALDDRQIADLIRYLQSPVAGPACRQGRSPRSHDRPPRAGRGGPGGVASGIVADRAVSSGAAAPDGDRQPAATRDSRCGSRS